MICLELNRASGFFAFSGKLWLVSCRMHGMLSQGPTHGPKSQVNYFIILYTSIFIRLSHFYQEFYAHCIITIADGGME